MKKATVIGFIPAIEKKGKKKNKKNDVTETVENSLEEVTEEK
jgi:hypothetical protein